MAYGTYEDRLRFIGGSSIGFTERWTGMVIFDGVHLHEMITWAPGRHAFSFILIRGNDPGVSYSVTF